MPCKYLSSKDLLFYRTHEGNVSIFGPEAALALLCGNFNFAEQSKPYIYRYDLPYYQYMIDFYTGTGNSSYTNVGKDWCKRNKPWTLMSADEIGQVVRKLKDNRE